jgi:hypothetical protein
VDGSGMTATQRLACREGDLTMKRARALRWSSAMVAVALCVAAPAGSKTSDHVMLRQLSGGKEPPCSSFGAFFRVLPDGTIAPEPFVVPKGRVLVVTDFVWSAIHQPPFADLVAGQSLRAKLSSYSAPATDESLLYTSEPVDLTAANVTGRPGAHSKIASGAMVGAGRLLCPFAERAPSGGGSITVMIEGSIVYGHLARGR